MSTLEAPSTAARPNFGTASCLPPDSKISQGRLTAPQLFRILADRTRLQLLSLLRQGNELDVSELRRALGLPQPSVSHHLALLRVAGLLVGRRVGKRRFYSLSDDITSTTDGGLMFKSADACEVRLDRRALTCRTSSCPPMG
jgi:DNA-binding transcriptional ArsR family regulator